MHPRANPTRRALVLKLHAEGKTYKQIADKIGISVPGVGYYISPPKRLSKSDGPPKPNGAATSLHDRILDYARPYIMAEIRERLGG